MHTFGLSQLTIYAGVLLLLLVPLHVERTLCYSTSSKSCLPYPPIDSDILRLGRALGRLVASSLLGRTKL